MVGSDYKVLLEKYRREREDLKGKLAVAESKMDALAVELGIDRGISVEELSVLQERLESERVDAEARLQKLVDELNTLI